MKSIFVFTLTLVSLVGSSAYAGRLGGDTYFFAKSEPKPENTQAVENPKPKAEENKTRTVYDDNKPSTTRRPAHHRGRLED